MPLLVVTAVDAEADAVLRDLGESEPLRIGRCAGRSVVGRADDVHVFAAGVGPTAAAATTATILALGPAYDLVVSAGIAGGFAGRSSIGDLVVANEVVAADLGALTDEGFLAVAELGMAGGGAAPLDPERLRARLSGGPYRLVVGAILTLSCMSGTQQRAVELAGRYPAAVAEAMEGYGVLDAWRRAEPDPSSTFAEVRAISNLVGRRDRSAWDLPTAFDVLAAAFGTLVSSQPHPIAGGSAP